MKNFLQRSFTRKRKFIGTTLGFVLLFSMNAFSLSPALDQTSSPDTSTIFSNPMFLILASLILFLLIIIIVLAGVLKSLGGFYSKKGSSVWFKTLATIIIVGSSVNTASAAPWNYGGITPFSFYFLIAVIIFEIAIIGVMINLIYALLRKDVVKEKPMTIKKEISFFEKMNAMVAIEKEEEIMFDHEYDGIRELDNNLPPWWKYGFYITIGVAVIYIGHYHITRTGALQGQEYTEELKRADIQMAEYRAKAANSIDETNVKLLSDPAEIAKGKSLFENCYPCHGKFAEGGVGPNLTDDFWLYGGDVKNIFKTIKYGTEKGMKSWKDEFSPVQISELASYVRSLHGTNPANAKQPQGEIYKEVSRVSTPDSIMSTKDSALVVAAVKDSLK